jgi:tetratricopeptide (TPR) repeat protein
LLLAGQLDRAQRTLERAISTLPVDPVAFLALGEVAHRRQDVALARQALARYLELIGSERSGPSHRLARVGTLALAVNQPSIAVDWLRHAADSAPDQASLLGRLAHAEWLAGRPDAARATLARAIERAPDDRALRAMQQQLR